ncbi:MAG: ABC transporter permease subunit [Clostridiales bacterium]|nr:ABC transporter permease subunit [Clostridiales bacterium]
MKGKSEYKKSLWIRIWKQRYFHLFVLLGVLFLLLFNYLPMFGILMAFKDYKIQSGIMGIFTSKFVGLKHFNAFFTDYQFGHLMYNTIMLSIAKIVFLFPLPIFLAIVLSEVRNRTIKRVVQTVSYLPYFISWVIVAGFCQILLSTTNGVLNDAISALAGQKLQILTSPKYFMPLAVITALWKETGWWTIIFLAAITSIDPTLYEAAEIDGASRLRRISNITLPGILPTITVVLILALGSLLGGGLSGSNFEQSYLLGNGANQDASRIIQTYVLDIGLAQGRYSYAAAAGLFQSVISVALVLISNFIARKTTGEGLF